MNRRDFIASGLALSLASTPWRLCAEALRPQTIRRLVLGSGAYGLGYALARPRETLVIERGIFPAPEFTLTGEPDTLAPPTTPIGNDLNRALLDAGILKDTRLQLPPLADFLLDFFLARGGNLLLECELVPNTTTPWSPLLLSATGDLVQTDLPIATILDTTDLGWRQKPILKGKRFSALAPQTHCTVDLPPEATWRQARLALHQKRESLGLDLPTFAEAGCLRPLYAQTHIRHPQKDLPVPCQWIPSAQFPDLMTAFEKGYRDAT